MKKKQFPVHMPQELWDRLSDIRWKCRVKSMNRLICDLLEEAVDDIERVTKDV